MKIRYFTRQEIASPKCPPINCRLNRLKPRLNRTEELSIQSKYNWFTEKAFPRGQNRFSLSLSPLSSTLLVKICRQAWQGGGKRLIKAARGTSFFTPRWFLSRTSEREGVCRCIEERLILRERKWTDEDIGTVRVSEMSRGCRGAGRVRRSVKVSMWGGETIKRGRSSSMDLCAD